jgi:hypothetical protein
MTMEVACRWGAGRLPMPSLACPGPQRFVSLTRLRPRPRPCFRPGHGGAFIPRKCPNSGATNPGIPGSECPIDSLAPLPERSSYVDQQSLKLQVGWLAGWLAGWLRPGQA